MEQIVFFLRGVPGSGKSTLAKELEARLGCTHISSDDLGLKAWVSPLQEAIARGDKYIVVDRCHSTYKQRMPAARAVAPYKYQIKTIIVTIPTLSYEELEKRITSDVGHTYGVTERMIALRSHLKDRQNDFISMKKEGWDQIINLNTNSANDLITGLGL